MDLIIPLGAILVGFLLGSFTLVPVIIILRFGLPYAVHLRRQGVLTSTTPIRNYAISLGLLSLIIGAAVVFFATKWYGALFVGGLATPAIMGRHALGRNAANLSDFWIANKRFLPPAYLDDELTHAALCVILRLSQDPTSYLTDPRTLREGAASFLWMAAQAGQLDAVASLVEIDAGDLAALLDAASLERSEAPPSA